MWYNTSSGRKPYYGLKESMINFFSSHIRFIHESNTIESAFEKPYLDDEYPRMHLDWNAPVFGGFYNRPKKPEKPELGCWETYNNNCQVQCFHILDCTVRCMLVGGYTNYSPSPKWFPFGGKPCGGGRINVGEGGGIGTSYIDICHECPEDCDEDFDVGASAGWQEPHFCSGGSYPKSCTNSVPIHCDPCLKIEPMVWGAEWADQDNPPSISAGSGDPMVPGSATLTFTLGQGPFDWTIQSSHFFFDYACTQTTTTTTIRSATIYADQDACGTCDVKVQDNCDDTLSMFLLCTVNGGWDYLTGAMAGDDDNNPIDNPHCLDSSFCLGATSGGYHTGVSPTAHTFYSTGMFDSPTLGKILIRIKQTLIRATGSTRYPDSCDEYDCSAWNCASYCHSRNLIGGCIVNCAAWHAYSPASCNACYSGAMTIMKSLTSGCSAYECGGCFSSCDEFGVARQTTCIQQDQFCFTIGTFERRYIDCP